MRRTKWTAGNGIGLLPEYQGRGGNALLYSEMEKTIAEFDFTYIELTQVAESAVQMRRDLETLGGRFLQEPPGIQKRSVILPDQGG